MDFQTAAVGWWPSCEGACRAIARPYLFGRRVRQRSACLFTRIRFSFPICQLFFGTCFVCSPSPRVICKLSTFVPTLFYFTFYPTQFIVFSYRSFAPVYGNLERVSLRVSDFYFVFGNCSLLSVISFSLYRFITVWHAFVYACPVFLSDNCSFGFVCFSITSCMSSVWLYVSCKLSTFYICMFLSIASLSMIYIFRILFHLVIGVLPWFIAVWHASVYVYSVFIFYTWTVLWNLLFSCIFYILFYLVADRLRTFVKIPTFAKVILETKSQHSWSIQ